ncbi:MAG: Cna B-type domain-containing protein [Eubacterium ramulus]
MNAGSNWTKTWEDLPEKKAGKALTYTVEVSDIPTEEDQYTVTTSGDAASGFVFKASHVSTSVEIPVSVTWDDAENQDGARIEAVEAELCKRRSNRKQSDSECREQLDSKICICVDVKKDGTRIKYEVKGTEADGYDVSVAGDILDEKGLVLTYKHIPAVVNVSARVSWNDANNQDGIRPTDTLVQLYADGTALGDKAVIESNKEWTKDLVKSSEI